MQKCKICKLKIVGRNDKIFCSLKCKNLYHTKLRAVTKNVALGIDRHLHRNRSILLEIIGKKETQIKVNRLLLVEKNFHFKYITHYHINSKGKTMHYLYDIGYMEFSDNEVLIVKNTIL